MKLAIKLIIRLVELAASRIAKRKTGRQFY